MKPGFFCLLVFLFTLTAQAQIIRTERKSLLDSDPEVVYLDQTLKKPLQVRVTKEAPVFSSHDGRNRLGVLLANQTVTLEAITDRSYRVRGQGANGGIAGWVAPWAFSYDKDPDFVTHLKDLYNRQMQVKKLIEARQVAIGMTTEEVVQSLGQPTKTTMRTEGGGQAGRWEFIDYVDIKHYTNQIDPRTGQVYRVLAYVTREEKGKTIVEFENNLVKAIEQSEDRRRHNPTIILPKLVWGW
ncbi:MAG: hypothetical protein QM627_00325 [Luteolibacter sp.]